ncbi:MAG: nucleotidyltransferase family protein [bacterium]|nr:nucleotidyltransferase family protein [bacterium]
MMKQQTKRERLEAVRKILKENKPILSEKFKVKEIGLFGSYVRGEAKEDSDIDVLVEFNKTMGLLEFIALENHLSDTLGIKVDLVMKSALKPRIGRHILEEVVYL